jgi:hypothetical protein
MALSDDGLQVCSDVLVHCLLAGQDNLVEHRGDGVNVAVEGYDLSAGMCRKIGTEESLHTGLLSQ